MKLIIDIPEHIIEGAKSSPNYYPTYHFERIWIAIVNGVPLPKGHGRLADLTELYNKIDRLTWGENKGKYTDVLALLNCAPTIIEADKEVPKSCKNCKHNTDAEIHGKTPCGNCEECSCFEINAEGERK